MRMLDPVYIYMNCQFSDEFIIKVGVHQCAVLSPLLFIIVIETLAREFKVAYPWGLLYTVDLVLMTETLEDLKMNVTIWKDNIKAKGFHVNINKTKTCMQQTQFVSQVRSCKMVMQYLSQRCRH